MMKKSIIIILLAVISMGVFGQDKGEKYLSPSISASFGREYGTYLYSSYSASQPLSVSIGQSLEFGYFFANDWRFAIALDVPYAAVPKSQDDNGWEFSHAIGIYLNPSFAYYAPLYSDKLFYTPEIGVRLGVQLDYVDNINHNGLYYKGHYRGFSIYANLFGLEYRVSKKFAIGVGVGSIYYTLMKDDQRYVYEVWQFTFNNASVSAKFYL